MSQINPSRKLFLDDIRNPPDAGWAIARTAAEALALLKTGTFSVLSLDHDLGEDESVVGTGYQVAMWLEEQAYNSNWTVVPADIRIHSQNPVGVRNIQAAIDSIDRMRSPKTRMRP